MRWTIKGQLMLAMAIMAAVMTISAGLLYVVMRDAEATLQSIYDDRVVPLRTLKTVADAYALSIVDTTHKMRAGVLFWNEAQSSVDNAVTVIAENWQRYMQTALTPAEQELLTEAQPQIELAAKSVARLQELIKTKDVIDLAKFADMELYAAIDPLGATLNKLMDLQVDVVKAAYDAASRRFFLLRWAMAVLLGLAVISIAAGAYIAIARISTPIKDMVRAMLALAGGAWQTEVPSLGRGDEIGDMAAAVATFKHNGLEAERLRASEDAAQRMGAARAERLDQLTQDFRQATHSVLEQLGVAADEMDQQAATLSDVAALSLGEVRSVLEATQAASGNVQTVAAASEQLTASVDEIARQIATAASMAREADAQGQRSSAVMQSLLEATERIGEVVELINRIAGQTNLLALNATIEAARAGDMGKGFAVVASEVKNLATQTARATDDIQAQISAVQHSSKAASQAIAAISTTIERVNDIAGAIAAGTSEQSKATAEIARSIQHAANGTMEISSRVGGINHTADRTRQSAEHVMGAAGRLSQENAVLRDLIHQFLGAVRAI